MITDQIRQQAAFAQAADAISGAKTLIVTAGAGMGVDSGMPDYRGTQGFWGAYPLYEKLGINYMDIATPFQLSKDPNFSWGFYAHCLDLYRNTQPHQGFRILLDLIDQLKLDSYVVTSNIDGQFQKAGFNEERIVEIHGSIHYSQCWHPCRPLTWFNDQLLDVDLETMRCAKVPTCKFCDGVARPNILMFCDFQWIPVQSSNQQKRYDQFIAQCAPPIVVVEMGAGKGIPTIRWMGEKLVRERDAKIVRINPREADVLQPGIGIECSALVALTTLQHLLA